MMSGSSMLSISDRSWKRIPSEKQLPNRLASNRFNNFHQRQYDFNEYEKKLLNQ